MLIKGHGLMGMQERLEFINGNLVLDTNNGTTLIIRVPNDVKAEGKGVSEHDKDRDCRRPENAAGGVWFSS